MAIFRHQDALFNAFRRIHHPEQGMIGENTLLGNAEYVSSGITALRSGLRTRDQTSSPQRTAKNTIGMIKPIDRRRCKLKGA
ncbi:MAG: hypothetical protein U0528_07730 [Anaerolineae bacterium]